jgi:hypothetical protein
MKKFLKRLWHFIVSLFTHEFEITIYRQSTTTGNMYKSVYSAKRIMIRKDKHLKFRDWNSKKVVEVRSSSGLEYKIEEK